MDIESDSDVFYGAAEDATSAVDVALMPRAFLVDAFPIRMFIGWDSTHSILRCSPVSQICSRMVSRSWLQEVRQQGQEESRQPNQPPIPARQGIFRGSRILLLFILVAR